MEFAFAFFRFHWLEGYQERAVRARDSCSFSEDLVQAKDGATLETVAESSLPTFPIPRLQAHLQSLEEDVANCAAIAKLIFEQIRRIRETRGRQ